MSGKEVVTLERDPAWDRSPSEAVPPELRAALEANQRLRDALVESGVSTRFGAMVLGLATLRQVNPERRE